MDEAVKGKTLVAALAMTLGCASALAADYVCSADFGIVGDHRDLCRTASSAKSVTVLAARSADGMRKTLLVTDYCGAGKTFEIAVKGVNPSCGVKVRWLDHEHAEWTSVLPDWKNGKLSLCKDGPGSAVFEVSFVEKQ